MSQDQKLSKPDFKAELFETEKQKTIFWLFNKPDFKSAL